jgi:hypothetical protein
MRWQLAGTKVQILTRSCLTRQLAGQERDSISTFVPVNTRQLAVRQERVSICTFIPVNALVFVLLYLAGQARQQNTAGRRRELSLAYHAYIYTYIVA